VTRIAEGGETCGAALIAGVGLPGAGLLGAPLFGPTALGEGARLGFAGGGAFRAISPADPLRAARASGLTDGLASIVGDEFASVEATFAKDSDFLALSQDFSSESVAPLTLLASAELSESRVALAAGGAEVREVISRGRFGSVGGVASTVGIDFWVSQRRFASGPRPIVSPTAKAITAKKNTNAIVAT
jgi:hypothetical protein